jgi:hypothetical protein
MKAHQVGYSQGERDEFHTCGGITPIVASHE